MMRVAISNIMNNFAGELHLLVDSIAALCRWMAEIFLLFYFVLSLTFITFVLKYLLKCNLSICFLSFSCFNETNIS